MGFTKEHFPWAFANTVSREESDAAYDLLHIPAPGNSVWAYGLIANLEPGHQDTWVDNDLTGVEPGWEQVADYALAWATSHARPLPSGPPQDPIG